MKLRELCELCNVEYDKNHSKDCLDKIRKNYLVEKVPNKRDYKLIRELTAEEKADNKTYNYKFRKYFAEEYTNSKMMKGGIYSIIENKNVYIGQTCNFYDRLSHHISTEYLSNNKFSITYNMLNNRNAKMTILEIEDDREQRLIKEVEYVYKFLEEGYNVVNSTEVLYNKNKQKKEYRNIKVLECDYDKVIKILKENGVDVR